MENDPAMMCGGDQNRINHAVLIIGWGKEKHNGQLIEYFIVKNSFGGYWGDKGYVKIASDNSP